MVRTSIRGDRCATRGDGQCPVGTDSYTIDKPMTSGSWSRELSNRSGVDHSQSEETSERDGRVCGSNRHGRLGLHVYSNN